MFKLRNKNSKEEALKRLKNEPFKRKTISFYKYVRIEDPLSLRDQLFIEWEALGVLGRIYVSREGINAQVCVPEQNLETFRTSVDAHPEFTNVAFKYGVEEPNLAFWKLTIKVREHIVADGLPEGTYDIENVGKHLTAEEWNQAMEDQDTVVVDMRNGYESAIGHFKGAVTPDSLTFREELQAVLEELQDKKDKKVLLYCTGGIRCEKTSAFLKHYDFKDVNQLHGGIIDYVRQVKEKGLENKFIGKNFVFDERHAERITDDVLANCYHCSQSSDIYVNCANMSCHAMFIQCESCQQEWSQCCSKECQDFIQLPEEKQRELRKGKKAKFLIHAPDGPREAKRLVLK